MPSMRVRQAGVRTAVLLLLGTFLALLVWHPWMKADPSVVATYKGGVITREEFQKQYALQRQLLLPQHSESKEEQAAFLKEYILLRKVILPQAKEAGVKINPTQVDRLVKTFKERVTEVAYHGDAQAFAAKMQEYGLTDSDIRSLAEDNLILQGYLDLLASRLNPSDAELQTYYQTHQESFTLADVSHILTSTREEAEAVKKRLEGGEDFARVAKEVSRDPSVKQNGGHLGEAPLSNYVPAFAQAALTLPLGRLSDPVKTPYGYHILLVHWRETLPFVQMKEQARILYRNSQKQALWGKVMHEAEQQANIQINE